MAAGLLALVAVALGLWLWRGGAETGGDAPPSATVAAAATVRRTATDEQLAATDGAANVDDYTAILARLERKLRQSRPIIAECVTAGRSQLAQKGVALSTLELLTRVDSAVQEPSGHASPPQLGLTCREVVGAIVAVSAPQ